MNLRCTKKIFFFHALLDINLMSIVGSLPFGNFSCLKHFVYHFQIVYTSEEKEILAELLRDDILREKKEKAAGLSGGKV